MFWSAFWGLKSAAFSDLESFVIMSQLLQLLVITLILKCLLEARYANVPSHYHVQGIKEMGAKHRHRQLCRPWCLGLMAACARTWHGYGSGEEEGESFHVCFSAAQCWLGTVAEQGSAWSASIYIYIWLRCLDKCFSKEHHVLIVTLVAEDGCGHSSSAHHKMAAAFRSVW